MYTPTSHHMSRDPIPRHHIACQNSVLQDTTWPVRWIYTTTSNPLSSECTPHHITCQVSVHHTTSPVMWMYITKSNQMSSEYKPWHHIKNHVFVHNTTSPFKWVYTTTLHHMSSECTHRHHITCLVIVHPDITCLVSVHHADTKLHATWVFSQTSQHLCLSCECTKAYKY